MNRQFNGALPCTAIIDVIGDYELPAGLYYDPAIRRCSVLAGNAVMIGNDLFSARKEAMTQLSVFNFPRLLAADKDCSVDEAMAMSAEAYRQAVNAFRKTQLQLFTDASGAEALSLGLGFMDYRLPRMVQAHTAGYNL